MLHSNTSKKEFHIFKLIYKADIHGGKMSSSNTTNKKSSEEQTKVDQQDVVDASSTTSPSSGGGRKLTPLPLTNPTAKPGQNQAAVHKLSTTMEEEDELDIDSNENRNQPIQHNLPKTSISSASQINCSGAATNSNENGNT